jgi:hypothetical protein
MQHSDAGPHAAAQETPETGEQLADPTDDFAAKLHAQLTADAAKLGLEGVEARLGLAVVLPFANWLNDELHERRTSQLDALNAAMNGMVRIIGLLGAQHPISAALGERAVLQRLLFVLDKGNRPHPRRPSIIIPGRG